MIDFLYGSKGPTERQLQFRDASETFKLYGGAIGGGKSYAICREGIRMSLMYPGNRGFMARHESKAFRETTLVTLLSAIQDIESRTQQKIVLYHNKSDQEIKFVTGSILIYGGLGGRENTDRVKSMELGWACIDEASECIEADIDMLESRLRWKLPDNTYPKFTVFYASNPEPCYLKDRFVTPQLQGNKHPERVFVQALPKDNQWLPDGYVERMCIGKPDYWIKRYINGSWDAAEGQVWPQFDYNIHVYPNNISNFNILPPTKPDQYPTIFGGLDHGQTNPTCLLGAYVDCDGNIFIYDEYHSPGLVSEHSNEIKHKFDVDLLSIIYADPSIWQVKGERNGKAFCTHDEYMDNDLCFVPANNAVNAGLNRVGEYLYFNKELNNPITGKKGSPRLFISNRCVNLVKNISEYQWKVHKNDKMITSVEQPIKRNDHSCDALRYLVMSRPGTEVIEKINNYGTFNYYKDQINNSRNPKTGTIGVYN